MSSPREGVLKTRRTLTMHCDDELSDMVDELLHAAFPAVSTRSDLIRMALYRYAVEVDESLAERMRGAMLPRWVR